MDPALPITELNAVIDDKASHIGDYVTKEGSFTRRSPLGAEYAIKTLLNMAGAVIDDELIKAFPDPEERVSASALVQAKGKLKPKLFKDIYLDYNATDKDIQKLIAAQDYRLFAIDGTDFQPPYQSKSKYAMPKPPGRPRNDGEPVKPCSMMHANLLFDLMGRTFEDCVLQPKTATNERSAAIEMINRLDCGRHIVLMDMGYSSFNMLVTCTRKPGCFYAVRTNSKGNGVMREVAALPDRECDREIELHLTTDQTYYNEHRASDPKLHYVPAYKNHYKETLSSKTKDKRWDHEEYVEVKCRVVKFQINEPESDKPTWEVLLTNLNRFEFPLVKMKELYHARWGIETAFMQLKYALGGIQFHSRKDDFVEMELYAHLTMFNVAARTIRCVHVPQPKDNKHRYIVNFKRAVTIVRKYFRLYNTIPYEKMLSEIWRYRIADIPGRKDKRNLRTKSAIWFVYRIG